jgi:CHAT domain-containing protein
MQALLPNLWGKTCLILFFALLGLQLALAQNSQTKKEITTAIDEAKNGNYQHAIPILKKYADASGFDDLMTLQITVYLNFCYLATKNEALNVDGVNKLTDSYLEKYGISKTDSIKRNDEMALLFIAGTLNSNVGNNEKMVYFLSYICEHYEKYHIAMDKGFSEVLYILAKRYYDLMDFKTAADIGELAWKSNFEFWGEKNDTSLALLDLLYLTYQKLDKTEKSLDYLHKEVDIGKEFWGENNPEYIACMDNMASAYSKLGDYHKALETNLKIVELRKEMLGDNHPDYISSHIPILMCYMLLEDYKKALEVNLYLVDAQKTELGEKDPQYLTDLNNLSIVYSELRNFNKALEISLKVNELYKENYGKKNQNYINSLERLALVYLELGDYRNALQANLQVVGLRKEVFGDRNKEFLNSLGNLSNIYSKLGDNKKALDINLYLVDVQKTILGEKDPQYLTSLGNLAFQYSNLGSYQKAIELDLKVIELQKQIFGEKHKDYFIGLNNLATDYVNIGNYPKALEINQKVIQLRKEILGEMDPDYFTSLANSAVIYGSMGEYPKALEINLKVVKFEREILGEKNPLYLTSLNNLALLYSDLGDYQKSLEINQKVVEIRKETLGENHPDYLMSLNNLASSYSHLSNYQRSLEINQKVVDLLIEFLGENNPYYLTGLNNLAYDYSKLGNYQKSLEINQKVVKIRKETLGEYHPDYITSLNNLALDYSNLRYYKKALEFFIKVTELYKESFGEKDPHYLMSFGNLAFAEFDVYETNSACNHFIQMLNLRRERVVDFFSMMTERQRIQFWDQYSYSFSLYPMFLEKETNTHPEGAGNAYNIALFSKGLLLNTTIDFDKLIAEKGTAEAIAKFEELKLLKLQIQRLQEKPIAERYLNVDSLENTAQQKETELVKISKEYGDYTGNMKINWKDVQAKLEEKDVAIEFVEYPTLTDTVKYAALVLRKGWQYPKMISLFRKDQINEFIKQDKNKIYTNGYVGKQIKKLIWNPLEDFISPGERVYFSPSGIIHQLAIENLPVNDSVTLGDRYQMHRLSSTKELAIRKPKEKNAKAVLYGGLNYDLDAKEMVAESQKYEFEKNSSYLAMRGYQSDTIVRSGWKFLNGTKPEVDQINNLMKEKQYQVTEYTGETGNEESFKSLSGKREGIIHIATHGFFLPVEESRKNLFMMQRIGNQQPERATVEPMLRSGLIMAGGNKAWLGEKIPENIEDGVLTAKEISRMDLRGTDLVVLSACETGLGDVSSEGVFGLQRSFKQAGVQTLVMSLWEVSDKATSYMMTEFYSNLLSGKEKREAFLEAKQKCKAKFPEPQYWAAFIMLD